MKDHTLFREMTLNSNLENILEHSIVCLKDGVFGWQVEREPPLQGELEAAVSKVDDGGLRVVHAHGHAGAGEVVDGEPLLWAAIVWNIIGYNQPSLCNKNLTHNDTQI